MTLLRKKYKAAMIVHVISEEAKAFYEKVGFKPSSIEPLTLMISIKEAQGLIK